MTIFKIDFHSIPVVVTPVIKPLVIMFAMNDTCFFGSALFL